jgi:predicted ABC-type ATPase
VPEAVIIAGANGAGKTTFARQLLPLWYNDVAYLNMDEIAGEDPAFAHPRAAGREFLRRLEAQERLRVSFALETTLSSRMYLERISHWQQSGYRVDLHFIRIASADFAVRRVAGRVAAGGHGVPEADVRRRYDRGLKLFEDSYRLVVDEWYDWFSDEGGLRLVAHNQRR